MTLTDLTALLPLIIVAATAIILLLVISFYRNRQLSFGLTLAGFALAFATLLLVLPELPRQVSLLFIVDRYALFFLGLLLAASIAVTLLTYDYVARYGDRHDELYLLLLTAASGSMTLVISSHFVSFILGLEILTVSLYGLIAYHRDADRSIEAGLKYLILAAVSSSFLFFGIALIYAGLGVMDLVQVTALLAEEANLGNLFVLAGLALVVIGVGFKLALVPFHMWTPDIYEGASAPVTAFVATVSKGGMFAFLLRYFSQIDPQAYSALFLALALAAIASMLAGNLLALLQNNVKRILAYSSIAHLGYMLIAVLASGGIAIAAGSYYLTAYFITILAAFGVVAVLSGPEREAEQLDDYRGLFWQRPWLAAIFTLALLSLAGIPLTAGFIGKFYLVTAGVGAALWVLVFALIAGSAIGLFYYLRIILIMSLSPYPQQAEEPRPAASSLPLIGSLTLAALIVLLIWLGVYPTPFIDLVNTTIAGLI